MSNRVMIATPMYGGMCTGAYVHGLLQTIGAMQARGDRVYWANSTNESLITRARNELVRLFLEGDFTHLMFIDADIAFDGSALPALLDADDDIVCGIYPKKEIDWKAVERAAAAGRSTLKDYAGSFVFNMVEGAYSETNERGLLEVRHAGTGFMLIKRSVFEALIPHVPTYRVSTNRGEDGEYTKPLTYEFFATSIDHTGALLSEDYHFCELWRKHGGRVYVQPFIRLEHIGTYTYTGDIVKAGGNIK